MVAGAGIGITTPPSGVRMPTGALLTTALLEIGSLDGIPALRANDCADAVWTDCAANRAKVSGQIARSLERSPIN